MFDSSDFQDPSDLTIDGLDASFMNESPYDPDSSEVQTTDFTCAVVSQQMILRQFGMDVSEAELVYAATSGGFLTRDGTSMDDVGRLLELHGVSSHRGYGMDGLLDDLSHGHKVIVGVDSGELWGVDSPLEDLISPDGADHAVVVTGLDLSDPSNPMVVINDPGTPDGAGRAIPLEKFLDAWQDSGEFYVATDFAAPSLAGDSILGQSFDPATGQYMDSGYWDQLKTSLRDNLVENSEYVADRFINEGNVRDAFVGVIVKTITASVHYLTDSGRNALMRSI